VSGTTSNTARVAWVCAAALAVFVIWVLTATATNTGIGFFYAVPVGLATWWAGAGDRRIGLARPRCG
jgi:hypothetical protein